MSTPFLTVVTRAYKKPRCLKENIKSLKAQTDQDYEQIFIIDKVGKGLAWADKALDLNKHRNNGKYIMVLDDDDKIVNRNFIFTLKDINKRFNPDLIIWRGYFTEIDYVLPPIDSRWGDVPIRTLIGSFNYCVKKEYYDKYVHLCTSGISGDFDFLEGLYSNIPKNKRYWLNSIMVQTQQKSYGKIQDISNE
jgi:glycosyltransferase involved in cell wall biosynthesis